MSAVPNANALVILVMAGFLTCGPGLAATGGSGTVEGSREQVAAEGAEKQQGYCAGDRIGVLQHNGLKRQYLLHVPEGTCAARALPLVVVLHGGGGDYGFARRMTEFSCKADEKGFVVVYPNGTGMFGSHLLTWNAGTCCGFARDKGVDDVGFLVQLIEQICRDCRASGGGGIDRSRVYVVGFSNGGMLTYKLAAAAPERVAAVAVVSGCMFGSEERPRLPVPVAILQGTSDRHVPAQGGPGKLARWGFPVNAKPLQYAIDFWVRANGCETEKVTRILPAVERTVHSGGNAEVVVYTIAGGGHSWPGGRRAWFGADAPFPGFNATDEIWEFFARHVRD